jgi:YegS/Rv2252/BmrU family lipid kinase
VTWWIIVNPSAGRHGELEARARAALQQAGVEFQLRVSRDAAHVAALVAEGRREGMCRFAAVGGDGTANLVVNGLLAAPWKRPPVLAILPAGSGSDFIRTFALPKKLEAAASHLVTDEVYPCDIGVVEGSFGSRYFLNAVNVGVAAASVRIAERLPRQLGGVRYGAGFWITLAGFPAAGIHLEVDGREFMGPAITVVIANGQYFGGGMNVAPRASVMDGKLDIQVFSGPRRQAFTVMPRVMRGLHLHHRGVRRFEGAEFHLRCPDGWPIEADGEMLGVGEVVGGVIRHAIDFKI